MSGLATLCLRTSYHKGQDDIARDFYLPAMRLSTRYDRAVAYFRSTVFIIAWPALREFVAAGGRMRILCSHQLSADDIEALDAGYAARVEEVVAARLQQEIAELLQDESMSEPAKVLAALVATNVIDLKIALLRRVPGAPMTRVFHDKLGILRDGKGAVVIFKGSMNETWSGLAPDGNLESIDVACSWLGGRDEQRTTGEAAYFEELWANRYPDLDVRPFPETARETLVSARVPDWEATVASLLRRRAGTERLPDISKRAWRGPPLWPHQAAGLAAWRVNGRRGILAFVTGGGKTLTALNAVWEALADRNEIPIVVVPDRTLFAQWYDELRPVVRAHGSSILRAGAGFGSWREILKDWTAPGASGVVLTTMATARSDAFRASVTGGEHVLLIADEVHRLGSPVNRKLLDEKLSGPRLGLSATPERAGDEVGTDAILGYFGGVLEPRYTLADAVRDRVLTPYFYRPRTVSLSEAEAAEWHRLTLRIAQLRAQDEDSRDSSRIERLLFARARIAKGAAEKVHLALDVVDRTYEHGQRWIIYCDDRAQLNDVVTVLAGAGHTAMPFHAAMEGDRTETLRWLDRFGGIVAAIKCLDEGVNIPSVTHALILASSKNPREFVQRRGRVLRRAPGKSLAFIYDAIVLSPAHKEKGDPVLDPITSGELARAIEFAAAAENPAVRADLVTIAVDAGINWEELTTVGVEEELEEH